MDIDVHLPIPIGSKHSSENLLFLVVFQFHNFRGHFEGLNEGFLGSRFSMIAMNLLDDTFPTSYRAPQTEIVRQSYALRKLIHQTTQNKVHKTIGFSSSGVRVWDFIYDKKAFGVSL